SIHASFQMLPPDLYTLSLIANPMEGGSVYGAGNYEPGVLITVSALAYEGYQFINWTLEGQVVSVQTSFAFTMPAEDVNLVANFEEGTPVLCSFSQGYWFSKPGVVWPYNVIVGGLSFTQEEGKQFWPPNTPTKIAFTQYAAVYLSGVTLSLFPDLSDAMAVIDDYFASEYPLPANGIVSNAAGYIGDWIDRNHCNQTTKFSHRITGSDNSEEDAVPDRAISAKAFPNPFSHQVTIEFQVELSGYVTLELFHLTGERKRELYRGYANAFEKYSMTFDGKSLPAGFYFYRITTGGSTHSGRLIRIN
ncbi:MAG TPA: T9SS type A sorting domain-containing protein, partial [Petrimonas sp.]|nr:T9SS type A sorting domain-containing protein [Petrimonas sp.]